MEPLSYDEWYLEHAEDFMIEFAETGADREGDFNLEDALEAKYQHYRQGD